jgi:hypothetical protein
MVDGSPAIDHYQQGDDMDPLETEMRDYLGRSGFCELYRVVAQFTGFRAGRNGESQRVDVAVLDAGSDHAESRYHVTARSEDGRVATGHGRPTIAYALETTHWDKLDG